MVYSPSKLFSPYPSLLMDNKLPKIIRCSVKRKGKNLTVKTANLLLRYQDNGRPFNSTNLSIKFIHGDYWNTFWKTWTPGTEEKENLGSVVRSLDAWGFHADRPDRHPVKGILGKDGFHILKDEAQVYWNTKDKWPEKYSEKGVFDWYFFCYGTNFKTGLKDFINVFGPIPMVPRWAFGLWFSRWYAYTDKQFLAIAKRFKKEKIPLDVMVMDTDWRKAVWGGFDWNRKYFPKPRQALKTLKRMGLKITLNDHPGYNNCDPLPPGDTKIGKLEKIYKERPFEGSYACNWSRKSDVRIWKRICLSPVFDDGMDFWWIDGWAKSAFPGSDSQNWLNRHYFELCEEKTKKRGFILSRWGGVGSHRYPVQFSGDTKSDWPTLAFQIAFTACSGNLGAAYWSHDIGGFYGNEPLPDELFIRWFQFGALSPVLRLHCHFSGNREPWQFKKATLNHFRETVHFRYALAPYLYTLAHDAHINGIPIVRPMYLEDTMEEKAYKYKYQYFLGRDLLVMPAHGPIEKGAKVFKKAVYFPEGEWINIRTGEQVMGGYVGFLDIPLYEIPVYVRRGAVIPCQAVPENLKKPVSDIHLDIYPGNGASASIYEDDGESKDYLRGRCRQSRVNVKKHKGVIDISLTLKGAYQGMPGKMVYSVNCMLEPFENIKRVLVNKSPVKGWKISRSSFGHTVKSKLRFVYFRVANVAREFKARIELG
jgi:alpha-glucosidase (family GH31 glycosyl hydrolase)